MIEIAVREEKASCILVDGQKVVDIISTEGPDRDGMFFLIGTITARVRDRIGIGNPVRLSRPLLAPHFKLRSGVVACVGSSSGDGKDYALTVRLT